MSPPFNPFDFPLLDAELVGGQYMNVACLTFLLYDNLITFDKEVNYVWSASWGLGKVFFLINRYLVPVEVIITTAMVTTPAPSNGFCLFYTYWEFISTLVSTGIVEAILLSRLYALWGGNRKLVYGLLALLAACLSTMLVIIILTLMHDSIQPRPLPFIEGCIGVTPQYLYALFIPILVFDTVVFFLTLIQAFRNARQKVKSPLLQAMTRDGLVYYGFSFLAAAANVILFQVAPLPLEALGTPLLSSTMCVMASRLMLNIRIVASNGHTTGASLAILPESLDFRAESDTSGMELGMTVLSSTDGETTDTEQVAEVAGGRPRKRASTASLWALRTQAEVLNSGNDEISSLGSLSF